VQDQVLLVWCSVAWDERYEEEVASLDAAGGTQTSGAPRRGSRLRKQRVFTAAAALTSSALSLCRTSGIDVGTRCIDASQYSG